MRLNRFFGDFDFSESEIKITDKELVNQLKNVLRVKRGDIIILCNGTGEEARAEVVLAGKNMMEVRILEKIKNENEPKRKVRLFLAILKKENFELAVQKAVETGVSEITPVISKRTVKLDIKKERLEKIIKEASEQSGRGIIPLLHEPVPLETAIKTLPTWTSNVQVKDANIFFDLDGEDFPTWDLGSQVNIFIGPEGGWDKSEMELARENGLQIASLGKLVLRAETATIVASYLAINS